MRQGRYIVARTFENSLIVYVTCAVIYFILVFGVARLLQHFENRFAIPGFEATGRDRSATRGDW
jgi:ABC-type amino acid transport system permease subunit